MSVIPILWLTILLQVTAAAFAFHLRFVRRQRWAWMLVGLGLALMSFRQAKLFADFQTGDLETPLDVATELIALAISMILLTGMVLMRQIAQSESRLLELVTRRLTDLRDESRKHEKTADALRRAEEQVRLVIDTAYDAFIRVDGAGIITDWNRSAEIIFGWLRAEVVGKPMIEVIIPLQDREAHRLGFQQFMLTGAGPFINKRVELTALHRLGHGFPVEATIMPGRDGEAWNFNAFIRDITGRRRTEKELSRRAEEIARSSIDLDQFARVASHDLQEPLRSISSYVQLLHQRYGDKLGRDAEEFIRFASEGAARMQRIIEDLLTYTQIDRQAGPPESMELARAVEEALADLKTAVATTGASVTWGDLPMVKVDRAQMVLVFRHLLDNAIKFRTDRPPEVRITSERKGEDWHLHVKDNGVGFDPELRERLFSIFQRLHRRNEYPGTGIGLAICKKIISRHRGRIWAESRPGQGATFSFSLPSKGDTTVTVHFIQPERR
ncbi:MAG TPA: ATP-binding protein [Planctomycetota bacterium]|nr:ATP-binding protein [Planctomycetota bacterium]